MNKEDITRLAREAGVVDEFHGVFPSIQRFAILVAHHEREACAKAVQVMALANPGMMYMTADQCATIIRNRSN